MGVIVVYVINDTWAEPESTAIIYAPSTKICSISSLKTFQGHLYHCLMIFLFKKKRFTLHTNKLDPNPLVSPQLSQAYSFEEWFRINHFQISHVIFQADVSGLNDLRVNKRKQKEKKMYNQCVAV